MKLNFCLNHDLRGEDLPAELLRWHIWLLPEKDYKKVYRELNFVFHEIFIFCGHLAVLEDVPGRFDAWNIDLDTLNPGFSLFGQGEFQK